MEGKELQGEEAVPLPWTMDLQSPSCTPLGQNINNLPAVSMQGCPEGCLILFSMKDIFFCHLNLSSGPFPSYFLTAAAHIFVMPLLYARLCTRAEDSR